MYDHLQCLHVQYVFGCDTLLDLELYFYVKGEMSIQCHWYSQMCVPVSKVLVLSYSVTCPTPQHGKADQEHLVLFILYQLLLASPLFMYIMDFHDVLPILATSFSSIVRLMYDSRVHRHSKYSMCPV